MIMTFPFSFFIIRGDAVDRDMKAFTRAHKFCLLLNRTYSLITSVK